jgi:ribulose-phosphate 3-epimerase
MTIPIIAPSLLAADTGTWGKEIELIDDEGISCLHLDIMDGRFVPNLSFGAGPAGMLRKYSDMEFDAHLMVLEPESMIRDLVNAGVDSITVHHEACAHLVRVLQLIRENGKKAGVAINPATPAWILSPVLPFVDRALVMTVNPGFGGQKAILSMLSKVTWLMDEKSKTGLEYEIQVDGGVNQENIKAFLDAGADNIVIGSALFQPGRTRENIRAFKSILAEYEKNR